MQQLDGAPAIQTDHGTTPFVMYRKDRVRFLSGADNLKHFRLIPDAPSIRVIAACCNTPVYLDFKHGHWLSLYAELWPKGTVPPPEMHTMTSDLPAGATLPKDIPGAKKQSLSFFAKLFGAWAAMGFRSRKVRQTGEIDV